MAHTKTVTTCLVAMAAAAAAQSNTGYEYQSPSPTYVHLHEIEFLDANVGFAAGDFVAEGGVWSTIDGGITWEEMFQNEVLDLEAMDMVDASVGWAAGDVLFSTTDGWQNHTTQPIPGAPSGQAVAVIASKIQFVSPTHGWVSTRPSAPFSYLYRTVDGGTSWSFVGTFALDAWHFSDQNIGWAAQEDSTIVRTTDGGQSWSAVAPPPVAYVSLDVAQVFSVDEAVVVAFHGLNQFSTHHTYDGGQTWASSAVGAPRFPTFYDSDFGLGPIQFGGLAKTVDGGVTWTEQAAPNVELFEALRDVSIVDENIAYACGEAGFIVKSTDGGQTWSQRNNGTGQQLNFIQIADDGQTGFATTTGAILRTLDGGTTWRYVPFPQMPFPFTVGFPSEIWFWSAQHAYIRTGNNAIIETTDAGQTWTIRDPMLQWPGGMVFFLDPDTAWTSNYAVVNKTTDGGQTWTATNTGVVVTVQDEIADIFFVDEMHGWFCGKIDRVFRTQDGGQTWERPPGVPSERWYRRARFVDPNTGWLVGDDGRILRTTDGGDTWDDQSIPGTEEENIYDLEVVSADEVYIASRHSTLGAYVKHTTDAGQTWTYEYTGPGLGAPNYGATVGIAVVGNNVWTCGSHGIIRHKDGCYADCDENTTLNIFDYICFGTAYDAGDPYADCDGNSTFNIFDYICFGNAYAAGCS